MPRHRIVCIAQLLCFILFTSNATLRAVSQPAPNGKPAYDFYSHGPYRKAIPKPSAILGYEAGETHTTFRDQERVILAIAEAARDRVRVFDIGKSVEGRPLRLIAVSSPENIGRLEEIRKQIAKLADPRTLATDAEADQIVKRTPSITWINHCIHGDETASFETAMWTLYTLAASEAPDIQAALKSSVVLLNPVFNPDGHERFVVYYNSLAVGSPEGFALEKQTPWAAVGRFNHYRFDMNRDRIAQSQPETRQESAAFLHWRPQVYVDQHGQPEIYFFPPNAESVHRQTDRARIEKWTSVFGRANSAAFDKYGWQYVTREDFDFFAPVYLDSWASLAGAIGMTYETDGGRSLARRRDDQTISTLRDGSAHHLESALATIVSAASHRAELLAGYLSYRRDAIRLTDTEKLRRVVILPGRDPHRAAEFAAVLRRVGIEVKETTAPFKSIAAHRYLDLGKAGIDARHEFPAGSLIVDLAQPQGRMARAFLEPETDFEPEFVKEQLARKERNEKRNDNEAKEGYEFYDITAWSLPYAYDLEAYWTEDAADVAARLLELDAKGRVAIANVEGGVSGDAKSQVAYVIPYESEAAVVLALRLLQENYRLAAVTRPIRTNGREWGRGTFVVRASRNPQSLSMRIEALAKELGVKVYAVGTGYGDDLSGGLGSQYIRNIKRPSIAVVGGEGVYQPAFGSVWHLLERQIGIKFTSIAMGALTGSEMSRFNVVILPEGFYGAIGKRGADALKSWAESGGVVIALGDAARWMAQKENDITTATRVGADDKADDKPGKSDAAEVRPKAKRPVELPGAIFRAQLDTTHFLGYGYGTQATAEIAAPLAGDTFWTQSKKGSNVVTFGKDNLRLSGFVWPDNTEKLLANTAYVIDEPYGGGHILLFLNDPTFRAYWSGLRRMVLNGIAFGPDRVPMVPSGAEE